MQDIRRNKLMLLVIIGLIALLPILAFLQYRWIGQLSDNEVERLRSNLQTSADLFSEAVNQEISPAQFAFRVSFTGSLEQISRELSLNYQYWSSRVARPDLIEQIYWVDYDDNQELSLYRFEPADGKLDMEPWPPHLAGWKAYFIERNQRQIESYNPQSAPDALSDEEFATRSALLMAETPAIPIPVSIDDELSTPELLANLNATSSGRAGHTLLTLNKDYLSQTFFPELQEEFFNVTDEVDLMIVSKSDPPNILYRSDSTLQITQFSTPDAESSVGRLRWNRFPSASRLAFGYASLIERDQMVADSLFGQVNRAWQPAIRDSFLMESPSSLLTDFPLQAIIRLAQEDDYKGDLTAEDLLVALTNLTQTAATEPSPSTPTSTTSSRTTPNPSPAHAWSLQLQHKTGSLAASVAANRWRNLGLSFGILLILGFAIVVIYISTRKAQWLADRQMSFVTGVSHELRTPLSVIKSAADNLADGVVHQPERMQKYGLLIRKETTRLTDMVEQILELAGVLSPDKTFKRESMLVPDLVHDALDACKESIESKDFKVDLTVAEHLPAVEGDKRSLHAALCNLINNAIKYSNGKRWLGVYTAVHKNGKGSEIQVSVSDKGIGIPQEDLPHIFEDFFRGPAVRAAQIKGNGIGLSIVKKTMEAHNGRVSVMPRPAGGTTFTLHLPLK